MLSGIRLSTAMRLPALFVLLTGVPLIALGWLGWRVLEQERALEAQRAREHVGNAATLVSRELERTLAAWEDAAAAAIPDRAGLLPPDVVVLRFDQHGVFERRGTPIPFYPAVRGQPLPDEAIFARGEALEFRERDLDGAAAEYRRVVASRDRGVRAAALVRVARCLRKQGDVGAALAVYADLAAMGAVTVGGTPAELVARRERAVLFATLGELPAAHRERSELAAALVESRFVIDRSTFDFLRASLSESESAIDSSLRGSLELAHAVDAFWRSWPEVSQSERALWVDDGRAHVAVWRHTGVNAGATIGRIETLIGPAVRLVENTRVRLAIENRAGQRVWGDLGAASVAASRPLAALGVPWTLHLASTNSQAAHTGWVSRRNLLAAGFGLMTLIIASAGYFVFRAVNRELSVARLQTDFVAAVSHEFRTPLTAISHLAEVLDEGGADPDRLRGYYRALRGESRRLQTMIESLLDFGRTEAGHRTYEFVEADAAALAAAAVREFRDRALTSHQLVFDPPPADSPELRVRCESSGLLVAIRNLIDNAIKYSPHGSAVTVSAVRVGVFVAIAIADEGPGLARAEQRAVFRKFVRGSAARAGSVKGTGIGLTLAAAIVKGHGGRLEVESEPGRGSRFTILLPAATAVRDRHEMGLRARHDERGPA